MWEEDIQTPAQAGKMVEKRNILSLEYIKIFEFDDHHIYRKI